MGLQLWNRPYNIRVLVGDWADVGCWGTAGPKTLPWEGQTDGSPGSVTWTAVPGLAFDRGKGVLCAGGLQESARGDIPFRGNCHKSTATSRNKANWQRTKTEAGALEANQGSSLDLGTHIRQAYKVPRDHWIPDQATSPTLGCLRRAPARPPTQPGSTTHQEPGIAIMCYIYRCYEVRTRN